ncbi:MAG: hypothetical protein ACI88H_003244, partial [Cocleimonas sp.]
QHLSLSQEYSPVIFSKNKNNESNLVTKLSFLHLFSLFFIQKKYLTV